MHEPPTHTLFNVCPGVALVDTIPKLNSVHLTLHPPIKCQITLSLLLVINHTIGRLKITQKKTWNLTSLSLSLSLSRQHSHLDTHTHKRSSLLSKEVIQAKKLKQERDATFFSQVKSCPLFSFFLEHMFLYDQLANYQAFLQRERERERDGELNIFDPPLCDNFPIRLCKFHGGSCHY